MTLQPYLATSAPLVCLLFISLVQGDAPPAKEPEQVLRTFLAEFVAITPGIGSYPASFSMGSAGSDAPQAEKPAHVVRLATPFAIAKYEVTQELYEAVIGKNPSRWKGPRNSVEMVNWSEAVEFCRKATAVLREKKLLARNDVIRLPTEAEWEYACRANTTTRYSFGDSEDDLKNYAWFRANSKGEDPPVGRKKPNAWGLYDMHGYIWEWCQDAWHPGYEGAPADSAAWESPDAKDRVLRGGSWADSADTCRSAYRHHLPADQRSDTVGFRCVKASIATADWPQFLGPNRNGASSETGLALNWPAAGPTILWQKPVGDGYSAPVISGKRLILSHRSQDKEIVECLDATSGTAIWKFDYATAYHDDYGKGDGPRATPLIADSRVYTLGAEGTLHCLELETGAKVWARTLNADYQVAKGFFGVATSPLLEGDRLLINIGGKDTGAGIVALDKATGKELWRATNHEASYSSPIAATIDGVRHVFFFTREGLVSLDPANGSIRFSRRWRSRQFASVNAATPLVVGDQLFLSASYDTGAVLLHVRKDGCDEIWKGDEILSNHYSTSILANGYLYGCDGRQEERARLRCVEWKTGKVLWNRDRFGCASLLLAQGHIIALTETGELVLIEATPDAFREKARARVFGHECRAALALADGRLYGRDSQKLICWNLRQEQK